MSELAESILRALSFFVGLLLGVFIALLLVWTREENER